ncbi:unnamed protein product [Phaeothamnion confervicola]
MEAPVGAAVPLLPEPERAMLVAGRVLDRLLFVWARPDNPRLLHIDQSQIQTVVPLIQHVCFNSLEVTRSVLRRCATALPQLESARMWPFVKLLFSMVEVTDRHQQERVAMAMETLVHIVGQIVRNSFHHAQEVSCRRRGKTIGTDRVSKTRESEKRKEQGKKEGANGASF